MILPGGRDLARRAVGQPGVGPVVVPVDVGANDGPGVLDRLELLAPDAALLSIEDVFTAIAAQVDGTPCCTYVGADGTGHYVKMVHNGIEYADIQLIAEAYDLPRHGVGLEVPEIAQVYHEWNEGDLDSFLIEITATVLDKNDERTGKPLVDVILDQAEQKGTGRWTAQDALELGRAADRDHRGRLRAARRRRGRLPRALGPGRRRGEDRLEKRLRIRGARDENGGPTVGA